MNRILKKNMQQQARARRTRKRIQSETSPRPRLSVFRSNTHIYAQIIDDANGKTIAAASDTELKTKPKNKSEAAAAVGKLIAEKAIKAKVNTVVFDRGSYAYQGRVKALAEAARENKLTF